MTSPAWFGFVTGLHLAILQFCFFFCLLINVTSTYVTYISIVLAWMAGSLVGLLWDRLAPVPTIVLGVASYYAIYAAVAANPLDGRMLPIAVLGVLCAGLWAGRFFVDMLPRFARADGVFFHENNGFLAGIIGVFIGFTLLGKPFLLGAPLISGVILLLHWVSLADPAPADGAAEPD